MARDPADSCPQEIQAIDPTPWKEELAAENEYRPWEAEDITELAYFKRRYLEVRAENERLRKALDEIKTIGKSVPELGSRRDDPGEEREVEIDAALTDCYQIADEMLDDIRLRQALAAKSPNGDENHPQERES